jgi:hypothetical protein
MARPAKTRSPEKTDRIAKANVDHGALATAGEAAAELSKQIALVDKQFGIGIPYDKATFVSHARHLVSNIGLQSLELGLIFIQIRAREPHGEFLGVLDSIGVNARFAQRAMQVARKFGGDAHRKALAERLGAAKVLALLAEDESDIDALADGGELAGFTADEFARMTKADVIKALKAEREEHADEKSADEEIIRKKDDRINKLSRRSTRSSTREQATELLKDMDAYTIEVATNLKHLRDTIGSINALYSDAKEQVDEEVAQRIEQSQRSAADWLHQVADDLGE